MTSFIGSLLLRRSHHAGRWASEDPLTDALAAVAREIPGLPACLLDFFGVEPQGDRKLQVATQVFHAGVGRVDLEIRTDTGPVLWVEVKDAAPESGDQLERYVAGARDSEIRLVLLNRFGSDPASREVDAYRWPRLAFSLRRFRDETALSEKDRWLLSDLLEHLEERGLAVNQPIGADLGRIAAEFRMAAGSLASLHGDVRDRLEGQGYHLISASARRSGLAGHGEFWPSEWQITCTPTAALPGTTFEVFGEFDREDDEIQQARFTFTIGVRYQPGSDEQAAEARRRLPDDDLGFSSRLVA